MVGNIPSNNISLDRILCSYEFQSILTLNHTLLEWNPFPTLMSSRPIAPKPNVYIHDLPTVSTTFNSTTNSKLKFNCHLLGASQKYPSFAGRCNFLRLFFKPLRGPFLIGRSIALVSSLPVGSSIAFELLATELFWSPWSFESLRFLLWLSTFLIGFMGFVNCKNFISEFESFSLKCWLNFQLINTIVNLHFLVSAFFQTNSM